jgi:hypothetical protein
MAIIAGNYRHVMVYNISSSISLRCEKQKATARVRFKGQRPGVKKDWAVGVLAIAASGAAM